MNPVPLPDLAGALGLLDGAGHHVAFVGGGGKTTLAFTLAGQLPGSIVVTCTTKMGSDQHDGLPVLVAPSDDDVRAALASGPSPIVVWRRIHGDKAVGVTPERCDQLAGVARHVVVEADGSRQRPFKAPGVLEPVIPGSATTVISVIGADALGRVIADQCHRPLRVAALAGCRPAERLTPERAADVLLHPRGARRSVPVGAGLAIVVNKVDAASRPLVDDLLAALAAGDPSVPVVPVVLDPGRATRSPRRSSR